MSRSLQEIQSFTGSLGALTEVDKRHFSALVEYGSLIDGMSEEECEQFLVRFEEMRKEERTAYALSLWLGQVGGHDFYLKRTGHGIGKLLLTLSVVGIPGSLIWSLVNFHTMKVLVKKCNRDIAKEIAQSIREQGFYFDAEQGRHSIA